MGSGTISGGVVVAAGSAGMAETFNDSSSQNSLMVYFDSEQAGGNIIELKDETGQVILSYTPAKTYQCVLLSPPDLVPGKTYVIYIGGSEYASASMTGTVTIIGNGNSGGNANFPQGGGRPKKRIISKINKDPLDHEWVFVVDLFPLRFTNRLKSWRCLPVTYHCQ